MANNKSDHDKPFTDINGFIPEVYRSGVNTSVFDVAFNRHLTKDDTSRVTGFIGDSNASALVDRRIKEETPHRQAFQLAPTMFSTVGTEDTALSYKAFLAQLSLMGVNSDRLPEWGSTLQFNWVPPINIDMLINFQDYFWKPADPSAPPQYMTIENRCSKATSKVNSYQNMLAQQGETIAVTSIDHADSEILVEQNRLDLFVPGFIFFTKDSSNINMQNQYWTVVSASYDSDIGQTRIKVINTTTGLPLVRLFASDAEAATAGVGTFVGEWYLNTSTSQLKAWNGTGWDVITAAITLTISLTERLQEFRAQANCACSTDVGWDIALWDDNGNWLPTPSSTAPASPAVEDLWYDLTTDELKQWDGIAWAVRVTDVSTTVPGGALWDQNLSCEPQEYNQWSTQNQWVHKSEITSTSGAKRAQLPILEYDSNLELNEWVSASYVWKYRAETDRTFATTTLRPSRIELEPIKGYYATYTGTEWKMYLFHKESTMCRDVDYTDTFVPGYRFRITDDTASSQVYTVDTAEYREITTSDPAAVQSNVGVNVMCTIITLREDTFSSNLIAGQLTDTLHTRIEPTVTTNGDTWRGYHAHWVLDDQATTFKPVKHQRWNLYRERSLEDTVALSGASLPPGFSSGTAGIAHIELTVGSSGVTQITFPTTLIYNSPQDTPVIDVTDLIPGTLYTDGVYNDVPLLGGSGSGASANIVVSSGTVTAVSIVSGGNGYKCGDILTASGSTIGVLGVGFSVKVDCVPQLFATPDSNEVRVYVNGARQYGTYTEVTNTAAPNYTVVGQTAYTAQQIEFVTGITFTQPLSLFDIIRVEVGAAPFNCMGNSAIPVRTVEDEAMFTVEAAAGTQPVYRSMTQCYHMEQSKTELNQYPLFNVFDVATSEVADANAIFGYKEDPTASVNTSVQRRIASSSDGREFVFEQHLVTRDDDIMFAYKNKQTVAEYWHSPLLNKTFNWNGYAWTDRVLVDVGTGIAVRRITTSPTPPTQPLEKALWFNTLTDILSQYIETAPTVWAWTAISDVVVNGTDPMLRTVWRRGLNNEQYVPSYVNATRDEVAVGDPTGDWEVVDQWMYNSEHANRKEVKYSQLITHFRSIIEQQPKIPGLQGGGIYTLNQEQFNYALGGNIKEHNDAFDTLISAVNVANVTPLGILDFAVNEYSSCILRTRDIFNNQVVDLLSKYGQETFYDFYGNVSDSVIQTYELNDYTAQLYGDSHSYDASTGAGIKNWISTIPMFNLGPKFTPHMSVDGQTVYMFHHDGHRSTITFSQAERDRFARQLCNVNDNRVANGTLGVISAAIPPATESMYISAFGGTEIRPGTYWYRATGSTRKLYRLNVLGVSITAPSFYNSNGEELPDGVMYYNKATDIVYAKSGLTWIPQSPAFDISKLWVEINFAELFGTILLEIESRLYDVSPGGDQVFNYDTLLSEPSVYNELRRQRYDAFVAARDIPTPLVNTTYDATDAFTWNYALSVFDVDQFPRLINSTETPASADGINVSLWQELYTRVYGTPYPHLEPWVLQGYQNKPTWWDEEYRETNGTRRWKNTYDATIAPADPGPTTAPDNDTDTSAGMWENIRIGRVPAGRPYPDGTLSTGDNVADGKSSTMPMYRYFSVNISNVTVGNVAPDGLFPPYFASASLDPQVRSLFTQQTQINNPSADYAFGDVGPTEWMWSISENRAYDQPYIAFIMQPAKFLRASFGPQYTHVDGLQVDVLFKQVYSHEDALFHGDVYNTNDQYRVRGLNQWYVNYNRYTGFDTNTEFRELWVGWNPRMTYQFGGIVDTSSFEIANKYFDVSEQDYSIVLVNGGVINDVWADAFEVSLLSIPPAVIQYNNQNQWKMELDSLAATARNITYYGVRHYPTTVNVTTNIFTANSVAIVGINVPQRRFYVAGDHTSTVSAGQLIGVVGSTGNDGSYTVTSVVYESNVNRTRITVSEVIANATGDGNVVLDISLPWQTGDVVVMSSSKFLPAPLKPETPYYIIRLTSSTYRLAETYQDAIANNAITITSKGDGVTHVSEVSSSFNVYGGMGNTSELWFHYAVDKNDVRTFTPPMTIVGMQTLINLIDGYAAYQLDRGIVNAGTEANDFDPTTGRLVDWAVETERFIDWAYGLRQSRIRVTDKYDVSVNVSTNEFTFTGMVPHWLSGTAVSVSSTGSLPEPLIAGATYYVVSTGVPGTIKLSITSNPLDIASHVDVTTVGSGQVTIGLYDATRAYPRFEINPYRNNVWIDTPQGIVSNVIEGPYTDIRVQQTIFDQYSRPVNASQVVVYRHDKQSRVAARPALVNDMDPIYKDDPYNYIHIGGGHFFIEGYEHYLVFNDYTASGALLYDSFLGMFAQRFTLDYLEKDNYTLRPTIGGYYLIDQQFERNIEGSIEDMRMYYDVLGPSEASDVARRSRALLGYKGRSTFLDLLNVNSKTQFQFYRGMIQSKGSVNSVKAYINSRRFVDAKLDDFWAWKVAEYGAAQTRTYPEIKLFSTDGQLDDVRLEFLATSEYETDPDVADAVEKGFQVVSFLKPERWYAFPEQKSEIVSPLFLDAETTTLLTIYAGTEDPIGKYDVDYWYDKTAPTISGWVLKVRDGASWVIAPDQSIVQAHLLNTTNVVYVKHAVLCDDVRVIRKLFDATTAQTDADYTTETMSPGQGEVNTYTKINSSLVRFNADDFTDIMMIFTINAAKSKISPAKLIDKKSNVVVQQVPLWDPAKGHHPHVAAHNIDLFNDADPAKYGYSIDQTIEVSNFWNQAEEGTVWLNTSFLQYMPYYDDQIYPNVNDRLYNWGSLAPYGDVKVYRWTKSTASPTNWTGDGSPRTTTFVRTRATSIAVTSIDTVTGTLTAPGHTLVADVDQIIFVQTEEGTLPTGILPSREYLVTAVVADTFKLKDLATNELVTFVDVGVDVAVIKPFSDEDWVEYTQLVDTMLTPTTLVSVVGTVVTWTPSVDWTIDGEFITTTADVYRNKVLVEAGVTVTQLLGGNLTLTLSQPLIVEEKDVIDIVRTVHTLTDEETSFDPDQEDDGTRTIQWKVDYKFSTTTTLTNPMDTNSSASTKYYYFWVEGSTSRDTSRLNALAPSEITTQIRDVPTPHLIVQRPKDDPALIERYGYGVSPYSSTYSLGALMEESYRVPVLYREAIIRGVASYVSDDDRYTIRFTRDFTLRDDLEGSSMLKNKHQEWQLFRQAQTSTIPRELWDRLTEALVGYKLTNTSVRVPALERELYDATYGTDTQFGLGVDQAFVESEMGLTTVIAYLQDANNDFSPIDIDNFFATHDFTTPEGIATTMNDIYTSFSSAHVNAMWFSVLHDSLSLRAKYKELMKTSWIALHGIRVLETNGIFDD